MRLEPSPCDTCDKREECTNICLKWELWFFNTWRTLQRIFLGGNHEN